MPVGDPFDSICCSSPACNSDHANYHVVNVSFRIVNLNSYHFNDLPLFYISCYLDFELYQGSNTQVIISCNKRIQRKYLWIKIPLRKDVAEWNWHQKKYIFFFRISWGHAFEIILNVSFITRDKWLILVIYIFLTVLIFVIF